MQTHTRGIALSSCAVALLLSAATARAEDLPKGTAKDAPASKGTTDVTTDSFEAGKKDDPAKAKDTTELAISAGGLAASGNSKLLALTTASTFRLRREQNQFSAALAGNYTRVGPPDGGESVTTVENIQGKSRYDRFLSGGFGVFLGLQGRRDRFQGLNLRLQVDPGVFYYFIDEASQQLWTELGYELQYDIRRDDSIVDDRTGNPLLDPKGDPLTKTKTVHSGRLFAGYSNKLNDAVTFTLGLEYLQALKDTTYWKFNGDAALTSKLGKSFSLATTFSLRYDHEPLPKKEKTDTITSLSLVYTLL
jgi:putative salt-induced outer membrane protein YdiY